jgi:Tol biopolymer transport system component
MSWRPDGQYLAMVAAVEGEYTIYRVSAGGVVDPLIAGAAGDRLGRLSWSPDGEFLVYSLTRGTTTWYEVLDAGGSTGVTEPVRITPALPTGDAINFGPPLQVLRPAWRPGTATAYVFYLDGETPRVFSIDVSGIGD